MENKTPFSLSDFLGYLIPGSLFLYSMLIIDFLKKSDIKDITQITKEFSILDYGGIFMFIVISYLIGHILSFISAMTIEKYANWKYDYPSKFLIGIQRNRLIIKGMKWYSYFWRFIIMVSILPIVILDFILGDFFKFKNFYIKHLDEMLTSIITFKANLLFEKLGINNIDSEKDPIEGSWNSSDFFRIISHYVYENSNNNHQSIMKNNMALYGFLRNISLLFNLITWYFFLHILIFFEFSFFHLEILFILISLSYISFMAFIKFYRKYTLQAFMLLVVDEKIKQK